ncbi:MAG: hypothetical protein NE327_12375 [Lentisphaeraceae bacterium]|nr:hypothetical protein [Lentisphaeraceae bacterium]
MKKDSVFGTVLSESYPTTTVSGDETGTALDHTGSYKQRHICHAGAVSTDIIVKLQDSPDNSTWTDVVDAEVVGADTGVNTITFAATGGDNTAKQLGYLGNQRYSRIYVVSGAGALTAVAEKVTNLES